MKMKQKIIELFDKYTLAVGAPDLEAAIAFYGSVPPADVTTQPQPN